MSTAPHSKLTHLGSSIFSTNTHNHAVNHIIVIVIECSDYHVVVNILFIGNILQTPSDPESLNVTAEYINAGRIPLLKIKHK